MAIIENVPKIDNVDLSSFDFLVNAAGHYIGEFAENMKIDSISAASENVFCACLKYFYNHFLRMDLYTASRRNTKQKSIINYESVPELENVLQVYFYICDSYNKIPSLYGFYCFSGITRDCLESWAAADPNSDKLTYARTKILKSIINRRESALAQRLESGGQVVGTIAVLNKQYGWNNADSVKLTISCPTISAQNLPVLPPPQ